MLAALLLSITALRPSHLPRCATLQRRVHQLREFRARPFHVLGGTVRWHSGLPPTGMTPIDRKAALEGGEFLLATGGAPVKTFADEFSWTRADLDGDSTPELVVVTGFLQDRPGGGYWEDVTLHIFCSGSGKARLCSEASFRFRSFVAVDSNGVRSQIPIEGFKRNPLNPARPGLSIGLIRDGGRYSVAVVRQGTLKTNHPAADLYRWSSNPTRVEVRCQLR